MSGALTKLILAAGMTVAFGAYIGPVRGAVDRAAGPDGLAWLDQMAFACAPDFRACRVGGMVFDLGPDDRVSEDAAQGGTVLGGIGETARRGAANAFVAAVSRPEVVQLLDRQVVPDAVVGRVRSEVQRFAVDLLNNRTSIDNETIRDNRAGELRVARLDAGE
ncbi:hypothetical protein FHS78_000474 [Parvibaculum indicum]|uniref:hypothetical protein n=1 Tax=Parvibaculum indicum TaxID=562969 RepID=UPI0014241816|nr:hypothetical protein [Parvibaculum indicum]NIJ40219.1 hypothetical protein [Parvibaculum indicum]